MHTWCIEIKASSNAWNISSHVDLFVVAAWMWTSNIDYYSKRHTNPRNNWPLRWISQRLITRPLCFLISNSCCGHTMDVDIDGTDEFKAFHETCIQARLSSFISLVSGCKFTTKRVTTRGSSTLCCKKSIFINTFNQEMRSLNSSIIIQVDFSLSSSKRTYLKMSNPEPKITSLKGMMKLKKKNS